MKNTRQEIMETALKLFCRHGIQATGVDGIAQKAGTTRQTLYNHFESKDQLAIEVLKQHDCWWREEFRTQTRLRGGDDPVAQLRSVFDILRDWFASQDFSGCLFVSAAMEFPSLNDPAHQAAKASVDAIRGMIADLASNCGFREPQSFATHFNIILEGAIVTEIVDRDHKAADQAAEVANILIDHHAAA